MSQSNNNAITIAGNNIITTPYEKVLSIIIQKTFSNYFMLNCLNNFHNILLYLCCISFT